MKSTLVTHSVACDSDEIWGMEVETWKWKRGRWKTTQGNSSYPFVLWGLWHFIFSSIILAPNFDIKSAYTSPMGI